MADHDKLAAANNDRSLIFKSKRHTISQINFFKSNNFELFKKVFYMPFQLGFFRRKKREELNQYKRKSYAHQRQSRALARASRDLDAEDRKILSQYTQMNQFYQLTQICTFILYILLNTMRLFIKTGNVHNKIHVLTKLMIQDYRFINSSICLNP